MTASTAAPRKPRGTRKKAGDDPELRQKVLAAALPHIPAEGFADRVLARACAEAGVDRGTLKRLFPDGPLGLVEMFSENADAEMVTRLKRFKLSAMKVRERIAAAVRTRIAVLEPHKEAARRAAAFLTLPPHAALGMKLLYRTVDAIWRAIGDTSTDFNFYTKRAILAGVYSTTLMRWFTDKSQDGSATEDFLHARIDDVMRFEKVKAGIVAQVRKLPSLSEILTRPGARRT